MKNSRVIFVFLFAIFILIGLAVIATLFSDGLTFGLGGKIGLVTLVGGISASDSFSEDSVFTTISMLDQAENDPSIKAVLLEINSPGGTPVATKQVVDKIRRMKKPVIAWISEVGASGGYYIAASTDYIMADEDSITGSIGVISINPNLEGLLEKIGVEMEVVKEGDSKDFGSPYRALNEEEKIILQKLLSDTFNHFKRDVIDYRGDKLNILKFGQVADGRILSGSQALEVGLIDELGSKYNAIMKASEIAGIQGEPEVKRFAPRSKSFFELISQSGFFFGTGLKQGLFYTEVGPRLESNLN